MFRNLSKFTVVTLTLAIMAGCAENVDDSQSGVPTNVAPRIILEGADTLSIALNEQYVEPGFVAFDEEDGILTSLVQYNINSVNTAIPGSYQIVYQVTDSGGLNAPMAVRTVNVGVDDASVPGSGSSSSSSGLPVASEVPEITALELVAFTDNGEMLVLQSLTHSSQIDLSTLSMSKLNIVASPDEAQDPGSVHFHLQGPVEIDRYENNAIYTLAVEGQNLDVESDQLPVGEYTLTVTPYELADLSGMQGKPVVTTFRVEQSSSVPVITGPTIAAAEVYTTLDNLELVFFKRLENGMTLDMNEMPSASINFVAIPTNMEEIGSVAFKLSKVGNSDGIIDRFENTPIFTAASDYDNIDISTLASGDYQLRITPYGLPNLGGDQGQEFVLDFSVNALVSQTILAVDDEYQLPANQVFDSGEAGSVASNDTVFANAIYSVKSQPLHGTVEMDITGMFFYEPAYDFTGVDEFVYEVRQDNQVANARVKFFVEADQNQVDPQSPADSDEGFTPLVLSADSKVIYVSSSSGNDNNSCATAQLPCKSLAAGLEKMRSGYPDHVYLKRGDTWTGETINGLRSGRSAAEPAVLSFYGDTGARPKIEHDGNVVATSQARNRFSNVHIIGLEFSAYKLDPSHAAFTGSTNDAINFSLLGGLTNILFEDNRFNFVELVVQGFDGDSPSNITLRRNIWTGAYVNTTSTSQTKRPSNLYASGVTGLTIVQNVFDYGGWHPTVPGAGANQYNHNLYIQYSTDGNSLVVKENIITRASSLGVHGRAGGLFENNFFARNAVGLQMGYNGHPLKPGTKARAINNVITEGESMVKGVGACNPANLCTPALWGLNVEETGSGEFFVEGNVVHSLSPVDTWKRLYDGLSKVDIRQINAPNVSYKDNVTWNWRTTSTETYPAPGRTLADYHQSIGGSKDFDAFMNKVKNRELQTWDVRYSADAINDYIRAGFGK